MILASGARVGPYEITAPLGAGGMGEVYRARDVRLGRDVAIKVLRAEDGDRRRFDLEARSYSRLNHPNIVAIYDVGEEDGSPYIVSELLDGASLREVLKDGPLPIRKLLDIAVQVATGLAAAHKLDVCHRDLKPENVMILRDGQVKILDFGLAKGAGADDPGDETRTAQGVVVGTLAYMSPEQAQGRPLDTRSDQFSFGVILYEMATGTHPFKREDRVSTLSAITREEPPPIAAISPGLPPPVRWVIDRCLAKEPGQRYSSTADLAQQLRDIRDHISEVVTTDSMALARPAPMGRRKWWLALGIALLLLGAGVAGGFLFARRAFRVPEYRFVPFATDLRDQAEPAWSPDGRTIAYIADVDGVRQVFARTLDSPMPARITSAPSLCRLPFWSADGSRVYYWSEGSIWSVGAAGGEPQRVINSAAPGAPASSSPDGKRIAYFAREGPVFSLRFYTIADGTTTPYKQDPFPAAVRTPGGARFSPDGRRLLVWQIPDLDRGAELWVLPQPTGTPYRISTPVLRGYRALTASWFSDNRHVAMACESTPGLGSHIYRVETDSGRAQPITSGAGEESEPSVSPDGNRMAYVSGGADSDLLQIWLDGSRVEPLLATTRHEQAGEWSPSGHQFAYVSDAEGPFSVWLRSVDEGWARPVVKESPEGHLAYASPTFSPDGQRIAYMRVGPTHRVWITSLSGGQTVPLEQETHDQHAPAWSPDGNWIAYARYEGSKWEITKAPSGGGGHCMRLADGGGALSRLEWSPSGELICFNQGEEVRCTPAAGGDPSLIAKGVVTFTFTRDGRAIYAFRRDRNRRWQLVKIAVANGEESTPVSLSLSPSLTVSRIRLHPDGARAIVSASLLKRDIWILEGAKGR